MGIYEEGGWVQGESDRAGEGNRATDPWVQGWASRHGRIWWPTGERAMVTQLWESADSVARSPQFFRSCIRSYYAKSSDSQMSATKSNFIINFLMHGLNEAGQWLGSSSCQLPASGLQDHPSSTAGNSKPFRIQPPPSATSQPYSSLKS